MIPILQCGKCKFGPTLEWDIPEEGSSEGYLKCSQYLNGIPSYVEQAMADCPEFEVAE